MARILDSDLPVRTLELLLELRKKPFRQAAVIWESSLKEYHLFSNDSDDPDPLGSCPNLAEGMQKLILENQTHWH